MKIALYYRHIDPADLPAYDHLCAELSRAGVETQTVGDGDSVDGFDYLFSIGGDGTLLSSVQFIHSTRPDAFPPILGINFGHLGFLTTAGKENLSTLVVDLLEGRFTLERRTLLTIQTPALQSRPSGSGSSAPSPVNYALNEVFLHRPEASSMLRTEVYVDDLYVATYAGDGVIVASPTGSTAYSLSCGGPILTPDCGCFVITPIGAHTLTLRPIIVPDSSRLRLVTVPASHHAGSRPSDEPFTLGMDSRRVTLYGSATLNLGRAPFSIRLIRMNTQNFFSAIRDKLMWGTEVRP
ncbi:MAG: NAD(+)/NADH kinase [Bacteroidales bacterium]|jgi:NAD+ kinase|nr:NAD(+)/NADH kinase [Bacteroidales bacterium]